MFRHCYGHALSLRENDTIKRSGAMKDCPVTCFELVKLLKFSSRIKKETRSESLSIRTINPTRWIVRAVALACITSNHKNIPNLCE